MSETRSPRPTPTYGNGSFISKYPFLSSTKSYHELRQTTAIPSIISFPKDIFQDIKPFNNLPRYLNKSTQRPYTVRTRLYGTQIPSVETQSDASQIVAKSTTTMPTTATATTTMTTPTTTHRTTTRKVYTIRPNRGQSRWKISKSVKTGDNQNQLELDEKSANRYTMTFTDF